LGVLAESYSDFCISFDPRSKILGIIVFFLLLSGILLAFLENGTGPVLFLDLLGQIIFVAANYESDAISLYFAYFYV